MKIPNHKELARYVGRAVVVTRDAIPSSGIKATRYPGLLVQVTGGRAYVLGHENKTPRPFVLGNSFTFSTL